MQLIELGFFLQRNHMGKGTLFVVRTKVYPLAVKEYIDKKVIIHLYTGNMVEHGPLHC